MDSQTTARLLDLNRQFYQTYALQFSATRQRLQPGVQQLLLRIASARRLLDVGCGNAELARQLSAMKYPGSYTGIDQNADLLSEAKRKLARHPSYAFAQLDVARAGWDREFPAGYFDLVVAFAVLHHVPGAGLRQELLKGVHGLLAEEGWFIHSEWQPLNSPRLRRRVQPWDSVGLNDAQLEEGDYLLDWRAGGSGLRYVHVFTKSELEQLASATGFEIFRSFQSDGDGGGLGLYQIWKRV